MSATLEIRGVRRCFNDVTALAGVDLDVCDGEFLTLLGPSGCGKTTLLRVIAGFEQVDSGSVRLGELDLLSLPPERRPVNMVFQRYALFPHLDVLENIGFGLQVSGRASRQERDVAARRALAVVRLNGLEHRRIEQLSGGQQQRVALARAIVNEPQLLLLDEPLGALDLQLRKAMQLELRSLHRALGRTFVYVTHDQEEALALSDRIVVMRNGVIEQIGTPSEIYRRPASCYVARFIGETNLLEGKVHEGVFRLNATGSAIPANGVPDPVAVSIRPEHLRIGGAGAARLAGHVEDSVFLGSFVRHVVRIAGDVRLIVQEPPDSTSLGLAGQDVEVGWKSDDAVFLAR